METKFSKGKNDNVIYTTSRCSNRCIMCCQPPKVEDDSQELFALNQRLIEQADLDTDYICITGGEPTLIGAKIFSYIDLIRAKLPECEIHLLSNGRKFAHASYLQKFSHVSKDNLCIGIPLHSDNPIDHDSIAGSQGAFYETLKGLHNLGILGYEVELRVIILKQNYQRLPNIAEFITLNLPFVAQVSFMGLEITGYAYDNLKDIWIEPGECTACLSKAISILEKSKISPRIFNLPLCTLPISLWVYACKSISDWKRTFLPQCSKCTMKDECCGLFATSKFYSKSIQTLKVSLKTK